jgi:3-oxoacyl-[acyl-carrier protein] reductase
MIVMSQLQKSVSVVVGASRGLGLAVASLLHKNGETVVGLSRNPPVDAFKWHWRKHEVGDVFGEPFLRDFIKDLSPVSKVVFCHALHGDKTGSQWFYDEFQKYMQVNCFGTIATFQSLRSNFCATGCNVVLLGSAISQGSANQPAYAMSKAALQSWMKSYTLSQKPDSKVCINMLWPGRVNTDSNPKREVPPGDPNLFREPEEVAKYVAEMLNWPVNGPRGQVIDLGR